MAMHAYANPLRFQKIADAVYPWAVWGAAILSLVSAIVVIVRLRETNAQVLERRMR